MPPLIKTRLRISDRNLMQPGERLGTRGRREGNYNRPSGSNGEISGAKGYVVAEVLVY